jgi:uncharacterized repeat protein (TIGR03803 family)
MAKSSSRLGGCAVLGSALWAGGIGISAASAATITTYTPFGNSLGANPYAGLTADSSGMLYGTTFVGGAGGGGGAVYQFNPATDVGTHLSTFTYNFSNSTFVYGANPKARMVIDSAGNLYGATTLGGNSSDEGVIYKVDATTHALSTLETFELANTGSSLNPSGGVALDSSGNLFGTTDHGGANYGEFYKYNTGNGQFTNLAAFTVAPPPGSGAFPTSAPIGDGKGNYYGTTSSGTVYMMNTSNGKLTQYASLGGNLGSVPDATPVFDSVGNLYGTTTTGGANGLGAIYEVPAGSNTAIVLAPFTNASGYDSYSELIVDHNGDLFGTAYNGGAGSLGTVFEYDAATEQLLTLYSFSGGTTDGANPYGGLYADASGNLWGTTVNGGPTTLGTNPVPLGTLFELQGAGYTVPEPTMLAPVMLGVLSLRRRRDVRDTGLDRKVER